MAQTAGTFDSYDAVGNAEDVIDHIYNVDPVKTPVLSAIKKTTAEARTHEWQVENLTAAGANAHIEGDEFSYTDPSATVMRTNHTQIFRKTVQVSRTQDKVKKYGRTSETNHQTVNRVKEMKRDQEWAILHGGSPEGNAKVAGNSTTARELASIQTWLTSNTSAGTGGADATGDGTDTRTTGTNRAVTEGIVEDVLQSMWTNSEGNNVMCVVGAHNKGAISDFTTAATRYVSSDDKKLVASIDVYDGDFHTVKVVPCRQTHNENAYIIDPEYLAWSVLDPLKRIDASKTSDATKKVIIMEATLEVCNQQAHGGVFDLTTS